MVDDHIDQDRYQWVNIFLLVFLLICVVPKGCKKAVVLFETSKLLWKCVVKLHNSIEKLENKYRPTLCMSTASTLVVILLGAFVKNVTCKLCSY